MAKSVVLHCITGGATLLQDARIQEPKIPVRGHYYSRKPLNGSEMLCVLTDFYSIHMNNLFIMNRFFEDLSQFTN